MPRFFGAGDSFNADHNLSHTRARPGRANPAVGAKIDLPQTIL